jgi:hypothetical protein
MPLLFYSYWEYSTDNIKKSTQNNETTKKKKNYLSKKDFYSLSPVSIIFCKFSLSCFSVACFLVLNSLSNDLIGIWSICEFNSYFFLSHGVYVYVLLFPIGSIGDVNVSIFCDFSSLFALWYFDLFSSSWIIFSFPYFSCYLDLISIFFL